MADGAERGEAIGAGKAEGAALVSAQKPKTALSAATAAAIQNGTRVPHSAAMPPMSGPATKPAPKAAPISPKFFARSVGAEMSAT